MVLAQAMISRFMSSSPASGSVLTVQSLLGILSVSLSLPTLPLLAHSLSLSFSQINIKTFKKRIKCLVQWVVVYSQSRAPIPTVWFLNTSVTPAENPVPISTCSPSLSARSHESVFCLSGFAYCGHYTFRPLSYASFSSLMNTRHRRSLAPAA